MVVHLLKRVDDQADRVAQPAEDDMVAAEPVLEIDPVLRLGELVLVDDDEDVVVGHIALGRLRLIDAFAARDRPVENDLQDRSEEHTYELQAIMRTSYDVFCLKKKQNKNKQEP